MQVAKFSINKFKKIISIILVAVILVLCFGCSNDEYDKLIKGTQTDVKYVALRKDFALVSNVYESRKVLDSSAIKAVLDVSSVGETEFI